MGRKNRVMIDCRDFPNEIGCTLLISGSAKEVLNAAIRHAVEEHGHQDTPELWRQVRLMMKKDKPNKKSKKGNKK